MLVPAAVSLKKGRDIIELVANSLPCFVQLVHMRKKKSLKHSTYFNKTLNIHFYEGIVNKCQTFNWLKINKSISFFK